MQINSPLCITSRLLPGVKIGEAEISIGYTYVTSDCPMSRHSTGRQAYRWFIDFPPEWVEKFKMASVREFSGTGHGSGTLQEGLESLLGFLGAFAEANQGETIDFLVPKNADLFPITLAPWAAENADKITALKLELSEHSNQLIIE